MIIDKFALQLFSVRNSFNSDPTATLEKAAELGYSGVEAAGLASLTPKQFRRICDGNGLEIYASHGGENDLSPDNFEKTVSQLNEMGCNRFVCAWVRPVKNESELNDVCSRFNRYAEMLKERNIQFFFHNHDCDMAMLGGKTALERIMESTDDVYFELDTGWCNFGGANACDFIRRYSGKIKLIHLKQLKSLNERKITELPNGNVIDVSEIVSVCRQNGIDRFIVEQDDSDIPDIESARINADYLLGR